MSFESNQNRCVISLSYIFVDLRICCKILLTEQPSIGVLKKGALRYAINLQGHTLTEARFQ